MIHPALEPAKRGSFAMNESAIHEPTDADLLSADFADEEIELAAGAEGDPEYSAYQTVVYMTWSSTCQCGC
jgi:hypothetical protein